MSEKEMFLNTAQRESQITLRVLKAFPSNQLDFRPHERSRTARELAYTLAVHPKFCSQAARGSVDFAALAATPPATLNEIVQALEKNQREGLEAVKNTSEDELNRTVDFAGQKMRRLDVLWGTLMDAVHHRGQFSVYIRMAGGKVPSIYGPSADDPGLAVSA